MAGLGAQCIVVNNDPLRVSRKFSNIYIIQTYDCHENENN